jgi:hypothetical protein
MRFGTVRAVQKGRLPWQAGEALGVDVKAGVDFVARRWANEFQRRHHECHEANLTLVPIPLSVPLTGGSGSAHCDPNQIPLQ